jgi:hypothetical protein
MFPETYSCLGNAGQLHKLLQDLRLPGFILVRHRNGCCGKRKVLVWVRV